jgi:hypothetical protein
MPLNSEARKEVKNKISNRMEFKNKISEADIFA